MNTFLKELPLLRLLLFFSVMVTAMVCADPGLSNWINSLAYDLKEGDPIGHALLSCSLHQLWLVYRC